MIGYFIRKSSRGAIVRTVPLVCGIPVEYRWIDINLHVDGFTAEFKLGDPVRYCETYESGKGWFDAVEPANATHTARLEEWNRAVIQAGYGN